MTRFRRRGVILFSNLKRYGNISALEHVNYIIGTNWTCSFCGEERAIRRQLEMVLIAHEIVLIWIYGRVLESCTEIGMSVASSSGWMASSVETLDFLSSWVHLPESKSSICPNNQSLWDSKYCYQMWLKEEMTNNSYQWASWEFSSCLFVSSIATVFL